MTRTFNVCILVNLHESPSPLTSAVCRRRPHKVSVSSALGTQGTTISIDTYHAVEGTSQQGLVIASGAS